MVYPVNSRRRSLRVFPRICFVPLCFPVNFYSDLFSNRLLFAPNPVAVIRRIPRLLPKSFLLSMPQRKRMLAYITYVQEKTQTSFNIFFSSRRILRLKVNFSVQLFALFKCCSNGFRESAGSLDAAHCGCRNNALQSYYGGVHFHHIPLRLSQEKYAIAFYF